MKLQPTSPRLKTSQNDALGNGQDSSLTILLYFGIAFALDRWLGTMPWFIIGMTLLASVGYFLKFKYRYDIEMDRLEAERRARREGERG